MSETFEPVNVDDLPIDEGYDGSEDGDDNALIEDHEAPEGEYTAGAE
jgi:hypothetical protein